MLKILFAGMLEASTAYYGDSIGLAPITLGAPKFKKDSIRNDFWERECEENPTAIACLRYES